MALQNLPNELLLLIASNLKTEADINSLSQVNHRVHTTIDPYLYEQKVDNFSSSALIYAARTGQLLTACKSLQARAEFNDKGYAYYNVCAISKAARNGSLKVLKLLLDHAASTSSDFTLSAIRQTYSGWMPMLLAATYGHAEVSRLLLDNGMDPNASGSSFRTPLYMACLEEHAAVVDVLLENPNTRVNTLNKSDYIPLYEAVFRGDIGIAAALLAHGAYVSPTEEGGWKPLHSVMVRKNVKMLRLFDGRQDVGLPFRNKAPLQ